MADWELHEMDCRLAMAMLMEPDSVDSIVCDPPYGLSREPDAAEVLRHWLNGDDYTHTGGGFMGKSWDSFVPGPSVWREAYRVLKPGGHLVAFFGTRTYDLGCTAIRLAGFEIRDQAQWLYGSGFPKSLDVSKAIDKAAGAEREVVGRSTRGGGPNHTKLANHARGDTGLGTWDGSGKEFDLTVPATEDAQRWSGWGTALKPANEPIVIARKPLSEPTVAANVLHWGTGALNIDGCRVDAKDEQITATRNIVLGSSGSGVFADPNTPGVYEQQSGGRWPANVMHDGSDAVLAEFPTAPGQIAKASASNTPRNDQNIYGVMARGSGGSEPRDDAGHSAARFFYCAKASKSDRNEGCDGLPTRTAGMVSNTSGQHLTRRDTDYQRPLVANSHPTVKPTNLMRWLCRLVTPPDGTILDPFAGSGSTGKAALLEGFSFIGCEMTPEYAAIARARLQHAELTTRSIAANLSATMQPDERAAP